tara:strand:- start:3904 stop:4500 length:597 start_codon:yes stop_codon:yes gene_type:complete
MLKMSDENSKKFSAETGDYSSIFQAEQINVDSLNVYNLNQNSFEYLKLVKQYEKEKNKGDETSETILKLMEYKRKISGELKNLSTKLENSGFKYLIKDAERYKHIYAMQLHEHSALKSTQKIHALLLSKVETQFNTFVKLKLHENAEKQNVLLEISDKVIKEIESIIGTNNVLDLDSRHIHGMVYYLTGNCFLNWEVN